MPVANKLQDLKNQQKKLAEVLTAKGIPATATEKYDSLVDKVAQIEELRGEERTLTNVTSVLSEPKSIVQLEYPIDNMIIPPYSGSGLAESDITATVNSDNSVTFNGTATKRASYNFKNFATLEAGTYVYDLQLAPNGCSYIFGLVTEFPENTSYGNVIIKSGKTNSYFALLISSGTVLDNVTIRQPILYKVPESKTLNAKLGSKNLFDKSTLIGGAGVSELTQTANGFTFKTTLTSLTMNVSTTLYLPAGTYYCSGTVACSDTSYKGGWAVYDSDSATFIINAASRGTINGSFTITESKTYSLNFYAPYSAPVGVTMTFENVQLELGSTATAYTPYISDFSTVDVVRCGKNILEYPYVETTLTRNGLTFTDNKDGTITVNGTATADTQFILQDTIVYPNNFNPFNSIIGKSIYINGSPEGSSKDTYAIQWIQTGNFGNGGIRAVQSTYYRFAISVKSGITVENLVFKPQIIIGSENTPYEPYNGKQYTPTSSGEVTGITNLYPLTQLLTNNAGVVFEQVLQENEGNTFIEVLPSSGKNGITKINQPIVDSSVDDNITPENIKKDVSILGVTGTYEGDTSSASVDVEYTYDESTKVLTLLL